MLGRCVDGKEGFVMKESGWLTSSKEIADVLGADGSWKHDRRHVHMISRSEIARANLPRDIMRTYLLAD